MDCYKRINYTLQPVVQHIHPGSKL